jgi:hypothetical protein
LTCCPILTTGFDAPNLLTRTRRAFHVATFGRSDEIADLVGNSCGLTLYEHIIGGTEAGGRSTPWEHGNAAATALLKEVIPLPVNEHRGRRAYSVASRRFAMLLGKH